MSPTSFSIEKGGMFHGDIAMAILRHRLSIFENHAMLIPSPWLCRSPAQGCK